MSFMMLGLKKAREVVLSGAPGQMAGKKHARPGRAKGTRCKHRNSHGLLRSVYLWARNCVSHGGVIHAIP